MKAGLDNGTPTGLTKNHKALISDSSVIMH